MDTKKALEKYSWLEDYRWNLVDKEKDEYTRKAAEEISGGYFMRILPGAEVSIPLQSCLMITKQNLEQRVHNIIIAEEDSNAHIITGCVQHPQAKKSSHIGISEFYVKENASLNFTMIHNWSEETMVRPRSAAKIESNGEFVSNYVCLKPVKDVQMYPVAFCEGEESKVSFNNILYGQSNSHLDIGSRAVLNGDKSKGEMISRAIGKEKSKIIVRGLIEGNNPNCKGHLECRGMLMDDESEIQSIPELAARKEGAEITHEAAVGQIPEKEIEYLMTRGLSRDQATSTIVRGFMDVNIMGLPKSLNKEMKKILDMTIEAS
ncbi:MAG: SufD family Fe-S cluster assembly protein [Hadesarchaea archaeon]|nr:SufD family Fe-S cluster assembly protein [Hadesarchaea archaeon]